MLNFDIEDYKSQIEDLSIEDKIDALEELKDELQSAIEEVEEEIDELEDSVKAKLVESWNKALDEALSKVPHSATNIEVDRPYNDYNSLDFVYNSVPLRVYGYIDNGTLNLRVYHKGGKGRAFELFKEQVTPLLPDFTRKGGSPCFDLNIETEKMPEILSDLISRFVK